DAADEPRTLVGRAPRNFCLVSDERDEDIMNNATHLVSGDLEAAGSDEAEQVVVCPVCGFRALRAEQRFGVRSVQHRERRAERTDARGSALSIPADGGYPSFHL